MGRDDDPIEFVATVEKVQTMVDGAIRVYLDLPETALEAMARLVACKVKGEALHILASPITDDDIGKHRKLHV